MNAILVSDIVEDNGLTVRENNLWRTHTIPIGSLVEIVSEDYDYDEPDEDAESPSNGLRLFVVNHSRDCDGTPLYDLSFNLNAQKEFEKTEANKDELIRERLYPLIHGMNTGAISRHYGKESLKLIREPKVKK